MAVDIVQTCREHLERFFAGYDNPELRDRALKAVRFLAAAEKAPAGNPAGWAAGIVYAMANRYCIPCGVPGLLNAEFTAMMGVSMETVRTRAAQFNRIIEI